LQLIVHHPQSGQWFGWTVLAAAFSPWWDKHGSGGALDVRRLFMTKDGYRGTRIYYPSGTSTVQQPDGSIKQIPNHEIAMQIVETIRTGGVFALPSEVDSSGTPRWKVEESQVSNNPAHILQYPKELDAEILNAMGIADDVLKSEATGSWAGKAVPQQATYCILEQWLSDLVCDVDRVLEKIVEINFGPGHQYEITTRPLADQMLAQQNGASSSIDAKQAAASRESDPSHKRIRQANDTPPGMRMGLDDGLSDQESDIPWLRMARHNLRAPVGGVSIEGKEFEGGWFIPKAGGDREDFQVRQSRSRTDSPKQDFKPVSKEELEFLGDKNQAGKASPDSQSGKTLESPLADQRGEPGNENEPSIVKGNIAPASKKGPRTLFEKLQAKEESRYGELGGAMGPPTAKQAAEPLHVVEDKFVQDGRVDGYDEAFDGFTQEELGYLNDVAKQAFSMRNNHPVIRGDGAARFVDEILEAALGRAPKRKPGWEWPYKNEGPKIQAAPERSEEEWKAFWEEGAQQKALERSKLEYIAQWAQMMSSSYNTSSNREGSAALDILSGKHTFFTTIASVAEAFQRGASFVDVRDPNSGKPTRVRREEFNVDQWFGLATESSDQIWTKQRLARFNDMLQMVAVKPETGNRMVPYYHTRLWAAMARNGRLRPGVVPGMADAGYDSPKSIIDRAIRFEAVFNRAIGDRMRELKIPAEEIGIRNWVGIDETPFTRFPRTQIGGNANPDLFLNKPRGIALDHGILDKAHPRMKDVPSWAKARVRDRIDAAIAHEYIESKLTPPAHLSGKSAVDWAHD
jgi:hypothetical protein